MLYQLSYGIILFNFFGTATVSVQRDSIMILNKKSLLSKAFRDPAGIRTQDPNIKSVMLYQLSYGIITFQLFRYCYRFRLKWCKYRAINNMMQVLFVINCKACVKPLIANKLHFKYRYFTLVAGQ